MKFWFEKGAWASKKAKGRVVQKKPEDIASVAVIRHAALGDMVLTRCFLGEVRKFFPNAAITLSLVSHYTYGAPQDLVDRIHRVPGKGKEKSETNLRARITSMRELGYHDIIFDLAATNRSYWICVFNPAWMKLGFPYRGQLGHLIYDATILRSDLRFEAEVMLDMLNLLGCKTDHPLDYALPGEPLRRGKRYIIYFTGGSVDSKRWPEKRFLQLIEKMARSYPDHEHIILEGIQPAESISELVAGLAHFDQVIAMPAGELEFTISLLKGARLLISNDTGIRNLAISAQIPTLGIFFSTVPFRYWPRDGKHDVVFQANGDMPDVDPVFSAAQRLIEKLPR